MDDTIRKSRKAAVDTVKREIIRSAAKRAFAESGLDGTSVREIARLAGYTTGAIYFYFANKEELYADILGDSLDRLFVAISKEAAVETHPVRKLVASFKALVGFYDENPRDLDLSLYLLNGARPRGLTQQLDKELNSKLRRVLDLYRAELSRAGIEESRLNTEVGVIFDEMIGSLVAAHTGRLKVIGTNLASVIEVHTENLASRLTKKGNRIK